MASIQNSAWNSALLNLSERFTDEGMVETLGIHVLKLPEHQVNSIWNKHKQNANLTAHELLKNFALKYESRQEAYRHLRDGLCKMDLNNLARLFEQWVEEQGDQVGLTQQSTYKIYMYLTLVTLV